MSGTDSLHFPLPCSLSHFSFVGNDTFDGYEKIDQDAGASRERNRERECQRERDRGREKERARVREKEARKLRNHFQTDRE